MDGSLDENEEEKISKKELFLLLSIEQASHNLILGRIDPEFRKNNGGQIPLDTKLLNATYHYREWALKESVYKKDCI